MLRRAYPAARIDWLVDRRFADAVRAHPALDGVLAFDRRRRSRLPGLLGSLRRGRYDLVVDLQGLARSGAFAWVTGARRRVGFADAREGGWLGVNERIRVPAEDGSAVTGHAIARMRGLLRGAGIGGVDPIDPGLSQADLSLQVPEPGRGFGRSLIEQHNDTLTASADLGGGVTRPRRWSGRYLCVAPTAQWGSKCWPAERFVEITRRWLDDTDGHGSGDEPTSWAAVLAAPGEREAVQEQWSSLLPERLRGRVAFPATSVGQMMDLIQGAKLLVGNDSAPLHLAVGLGTPTVSLFGPTDPAKVGPPPTALMAEAEAEGWGRRHRVLRAASAVGRTINYRDRRDDDTLMREIEIETVWNAVRGGR